MFSRLTTVRRSISYAKMLQICQYVLVAPNRLSLNFLNQNASKYQKFSCGSLLFAARFLMRKCFKLDKLFLAAHISVRRSISYAKMLQFAKIFLAAHIRSPLNFLWENASTLAQFPAAHCLYVIWKISAELLKRECYEIPNIFLLLTIRFLRNFLPKPFRISKIFSRLTTVRRSMSYAKILQICQHFLAAPNRLPHNF
jgi:hypothetical protein